MRKDCRFSGAAESPYRPRCPPGPPREDVGEKMMRIESLEDLLGEAAGELIGRVGQAKYEKWLKPMSLLSASESELVLGVANTFWLEWIEERYLKDVREGLERRFGRPLQVKLAIDPELFRSMRRSQKEVMDAG